MKKISIGFNLLYKIKLIAVSFLVVHSLAAQDSVQQVSPMEKWRFRVEPYILLPNMQGQTGISGLPLAEVDASTGDIFEKLKMGGMLNLEASKGKWTIASDLLFMNLEESFEPSAIITGGKVNAKQLGWEIAGLRRINNWLEIGAAGLLNSLQVDMQVDRKMAGGETLSQKGSQSKTWVDPMLIARLTTNRDKKFTGQFRGEIGGFGIGSDLAWQIQAVGGYRFSRLFDLTAGYRAISLDYTSGNGNKSFIYDVVTHGPLIKFGFNF